jgi:hypothetical protein
MNPIQLSVAQLSEINLLLVRDRLKEVPVDLGKAKLFLSQAEEAISELGNIHANQIRFDIAYNSCHSVGEALLAAYGYRTTPGTGQHIAVGEFLLVLLADNAAQKAAIEYDLLRETRNGLHYQAKQIGNAQADHAISTAQALLAAARDILN